VSLTKVRRVLVTGFGNKQMSNDESNGRLRVETRGESWIANAVEIRGK
jgi:hypothetical protein